MVRTLATHWLTEFRKYRLCAARLSVWAKQHNFTNCKCLIATSILAALFTVITKIYQKCQTLTEHHWFPLPPHSQSVLCKQLLFFVLFAAFCPSLYSVLWWWDNSPVLCCSRAHVSAIEPTSLSSEITLAFLTLYQDGINLFDKQSREGGVYLGFRVFTMSLQTGTNI